MKILLVLCAAVCSAAAVTTEQENIARGLCAELLENDKRRIAGFVRLAFHDCVGGCDGCVDLANPENNGLQTYINALQDVYSVNKPDIGMSRADFWLLCSVVAVHVGWEYAKTPNDPEPVINFKFGRESCDDLNPFSDKDHAKIFPDSHDGLNKTLAYFESNFQFTARQTTALLGAHTLGRATLANSGYNGKWVKDSNALDNRYYIDMIIPWGQAKARKSWQFQWVRGGAPDIMFLNVDICLFKDIQVKDKTGKSRTSFAGSKYSVTAPIVEEYVRDNAAWLKEFGQVFEAMIHKMPENVMISWSKAQDAPLIVTTTQNRIRTTTQPCTAEFPADVTEQLNDGAALEVKQPIAKLSPGFGEYTTFSPSAFATPNIPENFVLPFNSAPSLTEENNNNNTQSNQRSSGDKSPPSQYRKTFSGNRYNSGHRKNGLSGSSSYRYMKHDRLQRPRTLTERRKAFLKSLIHNLSRYKIV